MMQTDDRAVHSGAAEPGTKQKLFDAAALLFSNNGFSGVSIRDITGRVGIRESSFYKHYKSKDALLEAIFDYFQGKIGVTMPDERQVDELLAILDPLAFFKHNIIEFGKSITPTLDQIFRIIITEQFRSERARGFMKEEMMNRPRIFARSVFQKLVDRRVIMPVNVERLGNEYGYGMFTLSLEFSLAKFEDAPLREVVVRMFDHIDYIFERITVFEQKKD